LCHCLCQALVGLGYGFSLRFAVSNQDGITNVQSYLKKGEDNHVRLSAVVDRES
jgi:hypothetical protein